MAHWSLYFCRAAKRKLFYLLIVPVAWCSFGTIACRAQSVENVKGVFDGDKLIISYDLNAPDASQKFKVAFYSSHDNYANALSFISGDAGDNISQGKSHIATWNVKNALPSDFDKEITIKVKATLIPPAVAKLNVNPLATQVIKRGTTLDLNWIGGSASDKLTIELLKDNAVQQTVIQDLGNANAYGVVIPKNTKPGKNYTLRITNNSRPDDVALSQDFSVKPKVPMLVKVLPVAIIGGLIIALGDQKTSKDASSTSSELPALTLKP